MLEHTKVDHLISTPLWVMSPCLTCKLQTRLGRLARVKYFGVFVLFVSCGKKFCSIDPRHTFSTLTTRLRFEVLWKCKVKRHFNKRNLVLFLTWKVLLCFEIAFKIHFKMAILSFKCYFLYLGKRLFLGAVKLRSQISFS